MEITERNFKDVLPIVYDAINNADFMSFDGEFTGIGEGATMVMPFDTPALVYAKGKENVGAYTVVQFGLCCFRFDSQTKKFMHKAFNFYVFPRLPEELSSLFRKKTTQYQSFSCQADSLEFLTRQKFDFNKWIWNGVGFVKQSVLDEMKTMVNKKFDWRNKNDKNPQQPPHAMKIPEAHKTQIDNYVKSVEKFLCGAEETMTLKHLPSFEKRLLMNFLDIKHNGRLCYEYERDESEIFCLKLHRCTDSKTAQDFAKNRHEKKLVLLEDAAGFCNVIKAIRDSKKPLVGHNMYLDLLHTLKAFCCDLPTHYSEFKSLLNSWFPVVIDTKVVCTQPALRKLIGFANSLIQLYERLAEDPFHIVESVAEDPAYTYEHCSENLHEAGYDAYLTGLVFISLTNYITKLRNEGSTLTAETGVKWDVVSSLYNKIAPGRVVDMSYFDLSTSPEADMCPDRSHVFHLTFSCEEWSNEDITQLFAPYGKIKIAWIDEGSCFVTMIDRKQSKTVLKNLIENVPKTGTTSKKIWTLRPSIDYFKQQEALVFGRSHQSRTLSEKNVQDLALKKIKLTSTNTTNK